MFYLVNYNMVLKRMFFFWKCILSEKSFLFSSLNSYPNYEIYLSLYYFLLLSFRLLVFSFKCLTSSEYSIVLILKKGLFVVNNLFQNNKDLHWNRVFLKKMFLLLILNNQIAYNVVNFWNRKVFFFSVWIK